MPFMSTVDRLYAATKNEQLAVVTPVVYVHYMNMSTLGCATAERGGRPAIAEEHAFTPARAFTPAGRGRVTRYKL